jgi:hypothetical protein
METGCSVRLATLIALMAQTSSADGPMSLMALTAQGQRYRWREEEERDNRARGTSDFSFLISFAFLGSLLLRVCAISAKSAVIPICEQAYKRAGVWPPARRRNEWECSALNLLESLAIT